MPQNTSDHLHPNGLSTKEASNKKDRRKKKRKTKKKQSAIRSLWQNVTASWMNFESEVEYCELKAMKESKRLDPEDNTNYVKELRDQLADMFIKHYEALQRLSWMTLVSGS